MRSRRRVLGLCACAVLGACESQRAQRERAELERISRAVTELREAPNAGKPPSLRALEQLACSAAAACELRRVCVDAYRSHLGGYEAAERVRKRLQLGADGAAEPATALRELGRAEASLSAALPKMRRCSELEAELRRGVQP